MSRILTGIQSSGRPHLGNLLGAIIPAIKLSKQSGNESFFFIADLHSLINIKDPKVREENVRAVALKHHLVMTGGSDFHRPTDPIGAYLAPVEALAALRERRKT